MLLSVFLPLLNFLLISFCSRYFGKIGVIYLTIYCFLIIIILNIKTFYYILKYKTNFYILFGSWINFSFLNINWEFIVDSIAITIIFIVSIVSIIVHFYSFSYIKIDPHFNRFISYLSLFTFFIIILITASNFIQLFLGWEGVGICSYLLINFWTTRLQANKAAIKAMLINKIGDIGFLIAISLIFWTFKTFDFILLSSLAPFYYNFFPVITSSVQNLYSIYDLICFFLFIGVIGKSAQLGLHTWLPAAIEGPTPVSALIHAATIVTAGIYLLIRCSFFFEYSENIQILIIILGAFTAFISAFTAIFLYDLKKIIAYSTCSQLGYIALACGLSEYNIAFFHLINHAFFKALLFLSAGVIIHLFNNEQDIRKLGDLFTKIPFIYSAFLIGNIAIMGLPFLAGFYSKDLIIEFTYLKTFFIFNNLIYYIIILATICTAIYSLRLFYFLFLRYTVYFFSIRQFHYINHSFFIQFSLFLLIVGSLFSGYLLNDLFSFSNIFYKNYNILRSNFSYDLKSDEFFRWVFNFDYHYREFGKGEAYFNELAPVGFVFDNWSFFENEFLPWWIKLIPFYCNLLVVLGSILFIFFYQYQYFYNIKHFLIKFDIIFNKNYFFMFYKNCIKIFQNNFYYNEFFNYVSFINFNYYYCYVFLNLDKGFLELIGPTGISKIYNKLVKYVYLLYNQKLINHIFIIYFSILIYFIFLEYFLNFEYNNLIVFSFI